MQQDTGWVTATIRVFVSETFLEGRMTELRRRDHVSLPGGDAWLDDGPPPDRPGPSLESFPGFWRRRCFGLPL